MGRGVNTTDSDDFLGETQHWYVVVTDVINHTFTELTSEIITVNLNGQPKVVTFHAKQSNGDDISEVAPYHWRYTLDEWKLRYNGFLTLEANETIHSLPFFVESINNKFSHWNTDITQTYNFNSFTIGSNVNDLTSRYNEVYNATLNSVIDGFQIGKILFADPWYVDETDPDYYISPYGYRNLGKFAKFNDVWNASNNIGINSQFEGVFLNQQIVSGRSYYSVQAPVSVYLTQTGETHKLYLQNWNGTEVSFESSTANPTGVVFQDQISGVDPLVIGNFKGTQLSSELSGYSSGSQRKVVETIYDGSLHNVYSSLGHVWYEMSTDGGGTWTIANGGNYIDNGEGKLPAIDESGYTYYDPSVLIVYQEKYGNNYKIKLKRFYNGEQTSEAEVYTSNQSYDYNASPVIAYSWNPYTEYHRIFVVFQSDNGLRYRYGNVHLSQISWYESGIISGTDQNSLSPTIAARKNTGTQGDFYLAWQQSNTQISYKKIHYIDDEITDDPTPTNVTYNSGFSQYYSPSILVMETDNIARLCWVGSRYTCVGGGGAGDCVQIQEYKILFKGLNNLTRQWVFGTSGYTVSSPNINKKNSNSTDPYYAFAWSESSGENKFADNTLSTVRTLNTVGQNLQVANGSDKNNMYAMSFDHNSGSPYYLKRSNSLGSFYDPQKIQLSTFHSGREGVVSMDSADFYFALGDISVDNQPIDFVEIADTIPIDNLSTLNEYLMSEPISINDNSSFVYSVQYGINDSLSVVQAMVDDRFISFKVQLLDASSGEIIGEYDDVTYNSENIFEYGNISYQVNTQGIGNRTVKLKLVVNNNFNCSYTLSKIYSDESVLAKSNSKQIDFTGSNPVTSYELTQNYPNPFNPSTTIKYQIPQSGNVTIKVFDILGAEVATLVNEFQSKGRYDVNFDASKFSSGVYLYQLRVNDFAQTKKMILLR